MAVTNISEISAAQKQELVASLATLVIGDECSAESITAVADASGNSIDASMAALFASVVGMAGGVEKFCAAPGSGGGGGGGAAADSGAAAAVEEEEEEEEEMQAPASDMFGSGDAGGGDY
mmetsp:Transcript_2895/g.4418  ORF Transcript_2895/g.4418 Transcript_2895/m.4418 type:complete len:120 (+) Transcript_2895:515-874(+)